MAIYIKVNSKVAHYLGVEKERYHLKSDDTYLLWQADLSKFGLGGDLEDIIRAIGGVPLQPWETRLEQLGETCHALPEPEDERFSDKEETGHEEVEGGEL